MFWHHVLRVGTNDNYQKAYASRQIAYIHHAYYRATQYSSRQFRPKINSTYHRSLTTTLLLHAIKYAIRLSNLRVNKILLQPVHASVIWAPHLLHQKVTR